MSVTTVTEIKEKIETNELSFDVNIKIEPYGDFTWKEYVTELKDLANKTVNSSIGQILFRLRDIIKEKTS